MRLISSKFPLFSYLFFLLCFHLAHCKDKLTHHVLLPHHCTSLSPCFLILQTSVLYYQLLSRICYALWLISYSLELYLCIYYYDNSSWSQKSNLPAKNNASYSHICLHGQLTLMRILLTFRKLLPEFCTYPSFLCILHYYFSLLLHVVTLLLISLHNSLLLHYILVVIYLHLLLQSFSSSFDASGCHC